MAEVDFPRGAAPTTQKHVGVRKPRNPALVSKNNKGTRPQQPRREKKVEEAVIPNTKFNITPKSITSEMLFLGCVNELRPEEIIFELPNNIKGVLKGHQSIHFTLGQILAVGVTGPAFAHLGTTMVPLSVTPSFLHKSIDIAHLREGMYISGIVSSSEDRGYSIDIGMKDTTCFVVKTKASLMIGQPLVGVVMDVDVAAKRVFLLPQQDPDATFKEIKDWKTVSMQNIRPGNAVKAEVIRIFTNGLGLKIYNQTYKSPLTAFIPAAQLPQPLSSYSKGFRVNGKVIYADYISQCVMVTVLPHIVNSRPDPYLFGNFTHLRGLNFTVTVPPPERPICTLPSRPPTQALFISESGAEEEEESEDFIPKKEVKVVGVSYMLNVVVVSSDPAVVADPTALLDITDMFPGMVVDGSISVVESTGLKVQLSQQITAVCPANHLTDAPAPATAPASKAILARFKPEQSIKCRVLRIEENTVYVTNKQTLVHSTLHTIASYEHCTAGKVAHGVVTQVKKAIVSVEFYNNVTGYIKTTDISANRVGEVVVCQVVSCTPPTSADGEHALELTLDIQMANPVPSPLGITLLRKAFASVSIGEVVSGIVSHTDENGLTLVLDSGVTGILPTQHLSDSSAICSKLLSAYYVGTKLSNILVLNKDSSNMRLVLSKKASLQSLASEYEKVAPGQVLSAHIKQIADDSITVGFLGTNKATIDTTKQSTTSYSLGQSVRVVVRDAENASSLTVDLLDKITATSGSSLLREYFAGVDSVWSDTSMAKLKLGDAVNGKIVAFKGSRTLIRLDNHVLAFVDAATSTNKNHTIGGKVKGVVIDFDYTNGLVRLSLDQELLDKSSNASLPTNTDLFARVLVVNPVYLVVCVSFQDSRTLVYVPGSDYNSQGTAHCAARVGDELRVVKEEASSDSSRPIFILRDTLNLLGAGAGIVRIKKEEGASDDMSDVSASDDEEEEEEPEEEEELEEQESEEDENDFEEDGDFSKTFTMKDDSSDDEVNPDLDDLQSYMKRAEKGIVEDEGDDEDDEDGWPADNKSKSSKPSTNKSSTPSKKFSKKFPKKTSKNDADTKLNDTNTNKKQKPQDETPRNSKRKNDTSKNATNKKLRNK